MTSAEEGRPSRDAAGGFEGCFQVFTYGTQQLLSRSWLLDPVHTQASAANRDSMNEPWNGEFYSSFGHGVERSWEDAVEYGFISAGGGLWYSRTLQEAVHEIGLFGNQNTVCKPTTPKWRSTVARLMERFPDYGG